MSHSRSLVTQQTHLARNLNTFGVNVNLILYEEKWRLRTFHKYPINAPKSRILLAKAGFIYIGEGFDDTVFCIFCGSIRRDWAEEEDIDETHRTLCQDCVMVTGTGGVNIPLSDPNNITFDEIVAAIRNIRDISLDRTYEPGTSINSTMYAPNTCQQPRLTQPAIQSARTVTASATSPSPTTREQLAAQQKRPLRTATSNHPSAKKISIIRRK